MHTFENRLSWLYTWRQPGKKREQMRHSWALFDALSIFVECVTTRRRYMLQMHHSCTISGRKQPQASFAHRPMTTATTATSATNLLGTRQSGAPGDPRLLASRFSRSQESSS